jgi:mRNA interferase RelE/StbE
MIGERAGYRSLRAVGQRYRILYKVEAHRVIVSIVALGIRKDGDKADVYELAKRLVRLGLLGQD